MSKGWSGGSTRAWRRIRLSILVRDRWRCRLALPPDARGKCAVRADCVHHTRGRHVTGDDPRYMIAACTRCNLKAGDPTTGRDPQPRPVTHW